MTTENDFHYALDGNVINWQARLIFADWLEERGDPRAEGYRALGLLRCVPDYRTHLQRPSSDKRLAPLHNRQVWLWSATSFSASLPADWMELVLDSIASHSLTRREAEDAAALAFAKLPAERRAALLVSEPAPPPKPARKPRGKARKK